MRLTQALAAVVGIFCLSSSLSASAPTVIAWESLNVHGPDWTVYPIALDPSKTLNDTGRSGPTCDPRWSSGVVLMIHFSAPVKPADGALDHNDTAIYRWRESGAGFIDVESIYLAGDGTFLVLTFGTGHTITARYNIDLAGKFVGLSDDIPLSGDTDCQLRILLGDVDGDGQVSVGDLILIRNAIQQPFNPRFDIDLSGAVDLGDALRAKWAIGRRCP